MSPICPLHKNENGFVLAFAMMFLAVLGMLGTTALIIKTTDLKIGTNYKTNTQAFYIAEAGLARVEADLKHDLDTDEDLSNSTLEAMSGPIAISPTSASFYTVLDSIPFGKGSYTIKFRNIEVAGGGLDPKKILVRSTGDVPGPSSASVTLESYLAAENISPWNNAAFADGGGGLVPITGNVIIAGSVHILGTGLPATATVFNNQTGDCLNDNTGMDSTLASKIAAGTSSDLNAKFRVKNGRVDMSLGSGKIGSASSPFKGIYVTSGADGGGGVNADIIGGDNSGDGQNLYADKGASSPQGYDLGIGVPMPLIDTDWMDNNSLNLNVALELKSKSEGGSDISQTDGTNSIYFNSTTRLLTINGIIKVLSLTISDDITYSGYGTIYVTGTTLIDGDVLPVGATFPTTDRLGVVSTGNMTFPWSAQKLLTGAYYSTQTVTSSKQTELAGSIVCRSFNITAQVPKIWQVPSLVDNLPPGMPGKDPVWVFTEKTWKDISLQ